MDTTQINNKLDVIAQLSKKIEDCIDQLLGFCDDDNEEVRYRAIETLGIIKNCETEKIVYRSIEDTDELVRSTALEILGSWEDKKAEDKIGPFLKDSSSLVRSAAVISLAQIGSVKYVDEIIERLKTAESEDKVSLYYYLCRSGRNEYIPLFLNGLFDEFYRIRCATANLLIDLVDETNLEFMLNFLKLVLKKETTIAAKSSIKNTIDDLKDGLSEIETF